MYIGNVEIEKNMQNFEGFITTTVKSRFNDIVRHPKIYR